MKVRKRVIYKRILLYLILLAVILSVFISVQFSPIYEGVFIILLAGYLTLTLIQKDYLLMKLSIKTENQKQVIDNITKYSTDIFLYKDKNFNIIFYNSTFLNLLGFTEEENKKLVGKNDFELFSKNLALLIRKYDKRVIKKSETVRYKFKSDLGVTHDVVSAPIIKNKKVTGIISVIRNISRQETFRLELETKQKELESILDNLPIIAILKDLQGNYICVNQNFKETMGCNVIDPDNFPAAFYSLQDMDAILREDREVIETKKGLILTKQLPISKDIKVWYQIVKIPIFNQDGDVDKIAVFLKNIDDEKKIEEQKNTFVATLTHDLKNPTLAQIRALELFSKGSFGNVTPKQTEIIQQLLNSCKYMLSMIMTILDSYRYEDGNIVLNIEEFNLAELVEEVYNELTCLANERKQGIMIKQPEEANIWADKLQLKRVISNLLSNTINHGKEETKIKILLENKNKEIALKIVNQGEHIPQEQLNTIFDKYVSKTSVFNKISSGLGLYLTRKIIQSHNGHIFAESTLDGCNTFGFIIDKSINKNELVLENISE
ncbi:MAG: ATP-binding protein [Candidatus Gastranaerophilales bacterium]|nr:ATP-binding protein [Candidatus Gastranaerophilales bacterium]